MIGITNFDYSEHRELLENFFQLARSGKLLPGDPPGHTDGWGIGFYANGTAAVHKSGGCLLDEKDDYFSSLASIGQSPVLIVHLRKSAWPATTTAANAHPFAMGNALFAHNGTVRDYKSLIKDITLPSVRPLDTALDTEIFFLHVMSMSGGGEMSDGFRKSTSHIRKHNTFSSLTSIFSNGKHLYGYRDYEKYDDYYTLYHAAQRNSALLSSEPVSDLLSWKPIGRQEFVVLGDFSPQER